MVGGFIVTDMLAAVLNIRTQDELNENAEEPMSNAERRKVVKNKILAVGRMARVFSKLRYVTVYL
jgi:serine/threonine-protein phosphatase 2B catalytic subunit